MDDLIRISAQLDLVGLCEYRHLIIRNVESQIIENTTYTKVAFACPHPLEELPFVPVQSGTLLIDPGSFWCLKEAKLDVTYSGASGWEEIYYDYKTDHDGIPIPDRIVKTFKGTVDGKPASHRFVFDYAVDLKGRPAADFYMSAFGLPEPVGITAPPRPHQAHWWIAVAAAAMAVVGIWCRRRHKSLTAPSADS
jgi:hypothetical protein